MSHILWIHCKLFYINGNLQMLQSFLSQNNVSLVKNLNLEPLKSPQHQFIKPCWKFFTNQENKIERCETSIPKSPKYKRKKIFDTQVSVQSQMTAQFKKVDLTESVVQAYKAPKDQQKSQDQNLLKKKSKTNKQNGFCLAKGRLKIINENRATSSTIESEHLIKIEGKSQKNMIKMVAQNDDSQNSLQVEEETSQIFTFNSQATNSSFDYSYSQNNRNSQSQSFLRFRPPRNEQYRKAKPFC